MRFGWSLTLKTLESPFGRPKGDKSEESSDDPFLRISKAFEESEELDWERK